MYDYQNLLLIPYPPMDFTMPRSMGSPPRVYQDGIMVEGVTESGSKNEEVVSAEKYYHRIYSIAEANVYDASYVKLREVALSYRLPRLWTQKLHLQEASVTLTGRNLWTIYKSVPNIDPESALTTGNAQGVEAYSIAYNTFLWCEPFREILNVNL